MNPVPDASALRAGASAGPVGSVAAAARALGPILPLGAMALGLLLPAAAAGAYDSIVGVVLVGTFCGVLALPPGAVQGHAATATFALVLAALAAPSAWALAILAGAGVERAAWVALVAAVPIGPGAIGFAAALRAASPRFAGLVLFSVATAALVLPATAAALGIAGLTAEDAASRLLLLTVLPVCAALAVRRAWVPSGETRAGLALVACAALAVQALARVNGASGPLFDTPVLALGLLALACVPSLAAAAVAGLLTRLMPAAGFRGAEATLAGGYRNGTVAWLVAAPILPPEGHLFMALTALPVFATPAIVARLARR